MQQSGTSPPQRPCSATSRGCVPCAATCATRDRCAPSSATCGPRSSTTSPARAASPRRSSIRRRPGSRTRTSSSTCSTRSATTAPRRASTRPRRARCSARSPAATSCTTRARRSTRRARMRQRRRRRTCSAAATASRTGSGSPAASSSTTSRTAAGRSSSRGRSSTTCSRLRAGAATEPLALGNLKVQRDWGFAPDYVDGMIAILRQDATDAASYRDYVLGTGRLHHVWELVDRAFALGGFELDWNLDGDDPTAWGASFAGVRHAGGRRRPVIHPPCRPARDRRRSVSRANRARLGAARRPRRLPRGHARGAGCRPQ